MSSRDRRVGSLVDPPNGGTWPVDRMIERRETSLYPTMRIGTFVTLRGDCTFAEPVLVRLRGVCVTGVEGWDVTDVAGRDSGMGSTKIGSKL